MESSIGLRVLSGAGALAVLYFGRTLFSRKSLLRFFGFGDAQARADF
jgi:hypothetical protein